MRKDGILGVVKKNKYIKKWNSKVRIGGLMQWCFNYIRKNGFFRTQLAKKIRSY